MNKETKKLILKLLNILKLQIFWGSGRGIQHIKQPLSTAIL